MNKNKTSTIKQKLTSLYRNAVSLSLGAGILLASTHSSALGSNYGLSPVDFKVKVVGDLHTHSDINLQASRILLDPRSLRAIRNDIGNKIAGGDGLRGNWDVYVA